jgi:hypothetical protein
MNKTPEMASASASAPGRTLKMLDAVGKEDLAILDLMSMPGRLASRAPCHRVTLGLQQVVDRGGAIGQAGRYVLEVVSPFAKFEIEMTVQEAFDRVTHPIGAHQLSRQSLESDFESTVRPRDSTTETGAEDALETMVRAEALLQSDDVADPANPQEVTACWSAEMRLLQNVVTEAATAGPSQAMIIQLQNALARFTWLMDRAVALAPRTVATAPLLERLQTLIASIEASLAELVGDDEQAARLRTELSAAPVEVIVESYVVADETERQAETAFALAQEMAERIEQNDKTYPRKKAYDLNQSLLIEQEGQLRASLNQIGISIATLKLPPLVAGVEPSPRPLPSQAFDAPTATPPTTSPNAHKADVDEPNAGDDLILEMDDEDFGPSLESVSYVDEAAEIPSPAPSLIEPEQSAVSDPLREHVVQGLDRLFEHGEFGLAYHLATAMNRLMPEVDIEYSPLEFRLAAATGRYSGLTGQDVEGLLEARQEACELAQRLASKRDPRSDARRTMLLAGAIPAALFKPDDAGATGLVDQIGAFGSTSAFYQLISAVDENRKRGYPITAANLVAAAALTNEKDFLDDSVQEIHDSIEGFKAARFKFSLGERIKHALITSDGVLGKLQRGLSENAHRAFKEAAEKLSTRGRALELLGKITEEVSSREEIDGPARERLIGLLTNIGQQCEELAESMDQLSSLRRGGSRLESIMRLRDLVVGGIERVEAETRSPCGNTLIDAACGHANRILAGLLPMFRGRSAPERNAMPLAVSLHAPLLWLSGLSWTGAWFPSPYNADTVSQKILDVEVPLLGDDQGRSWEKAFQARKSEGAFVAATILLNIANWYGVSSDRVAELRAKLDADKHARKAHVRGRLDEVMRLVERMRRMAVGRLEQSNRMKETLETIDPARLPVDLPPSFLPESISGDHVEDFNAALSRIEGVEKEAKREFAKAEEEYATRIDALRSSEQLDEETERELRSLLESHDLTTLADWLNMMERGENGRPPSLSGPLNKRLLAFRENLPSLGQIELHHLAEAIRSGKTYGPLDYGPLDDEQRLEASRVVESLTSLKQALKGAAHMTHIQAHMMELVSGVFYEVSQVKDSDLTQRRRGIYVYDTKVALPAPDPLSLVLPEFGSSSGTWRVVVGGTTISTNELIALAEGSGAVLVFLLGYLNKDRRAQIRTDLAKRKRPMLFVDEALIASALADTEDRRRALVEIAQGYSYADPYKDYGRAPVPPEMFKGRTHERAAILDPFGSYVVYGGRRLGKTALLRHIASNPIKNTDVAFVDLYNVTVEADVFEKVAAAFRLQATVRGGQEFAAAMRTWLSQDDRRRALLLLDEADNFVRHETETGFGCISAMLQLQAETRNRFKFVLAGLHNVSRAVRAENSPLVQISNNPLRIGPLVDRDVVDAEFLVRGPLAAMGWEFDRREDVWRILSFTNYYPVLIQVFCQELVRLLRDPPGGKLARTITGAMVEKALSSSEVRRKLFETFDKTISDIEQRYKLLTYILARKELVEREGGISGEGATSAEVAEQAILWWPKAFPKGSDPIEIEYLLEEMEGFGISRRTSSGRFSLRSRMLLELMATDEADLDNKLRQFLHRDAPPRPFDPKNFRRVLGRTTLRVQSDGRISPLTDGQEADLLTPGAERPVSVIFGSPAAGVRLVESAIMSARRPRDGHLDVEVKTFSSKKEFQDNAKTPIRTGRPKVLVLSSASSWKPEWVFETERFPLVRSGSLRVVFVGGPKHAEEWASDPITRRRDLPNVRTVKLRPWTRSFLAARMEEKQVDPELLDEIRRATGGWCEFLDPLLDQIADVSAIDAGPKISATHEKALRSGTILDDLGVTPDFGGFMRTLANYADGSMVTTKDFQDLCEDEKLDPKVVGAYGDLVGIFSFPPDEGGDRLNRPVDLNPLALAALIKME